MDSEQNKTAEAISETLDNVNKVLGYPGTQKYNGFYLEEPNVEWRDEKRVDNVEEMRRSDGTARALLTALKSPLLATEWRIECENEEIEEFVEKNLFHMKRTWKNFLREALAYLDFGYYAFEIVWKKQDGKIMIDDLEPRIPHSIQNWKLTDGRFGIVQIAKSDDARGLKLEIPGEKLLVLTNEKEGDDVTGQSVLRAAYKHYKYKNVLYSIQGVAAERYGVGIPVVTLPGGFGDAEKAAAEEMAKNVRSNEKSFVVLPSKEWEFEIKTPSGNPQGSAIENAIEHHNKAMLMSILAGFLGLGSDSTGSFALSRDQSSFFLEHVQDKAYYLAEEITNQVIKRLVYLNFGEVEHYPKLKFAPLGDIDYQELSTVLKTLIDSGLVDVNPRLKEFTAKTFELPEIPEDELQAMKDAQDQAELDAMNQDISMEFDLPPEPTEQPVAPAPEEAPVPANQE